jgi:neutral ceramidase
MPRYLNRVLSPYCLPPCPPASLQGYANPAQYAAGIHLRLYARTFIAAEAGNPSRRFSFVNIDAGMASQAVTFTVVARLKEQYGGLYSEQNMAISGTHTHSGPAGGWAGARGLV